MNWVNVANTIACFVLLFYLLPIANVVHRWRHRLILIGIVVVVGVQMMDPLVDWIPDMAWPSAVLNAALAGVVTAFRHELWNMLKGRMA